MTEATLSTNPKPKPAAKPLSWPQIWRLAVTKPSLATCEIIAGQPKASLGVGVLWVCLSALLGLLIGVPLSLILGPKTSTMNATLPGLLDNVDLFICFAPMGAIFEALLLLVQAGIFQMFARVLSGQGQYKRLVFTLAAFAAPIWLAIDILASLPLVGSWLALLLGLYYIALCVLVVRAVHSFDLRKAGAAVLIPLALEGLVMALLYWLRFG